MEAEEITITQTCHVDMENSEASLYHQNTKLYYKVNKFPFIMGRKEHSDNIDLELYDPKRSHLQQYCSRKHASILKNGNNYELHAHGKNGTAILRDSDIVIIPIGDHALLRDGDGIKLGFLMDSSYREFIFKWSISKKKILMDKEIECATCGDFFIFTHGEQSYYHSKDFKDPSHCQSCRSSKKRKRVENSSVPTSTVEFNNGNNSNLRIKTKIIRRAGKKWKKSDK